MQFNRTLLVGWLPLLDPSLRIFMPTFLSGPARADCGSLAPSASFVRAAFAEDAGRGAVEDALRFRSRGW